MLRLFAVHVQVGDAVEPGQALGVLEAMKMQHVLAADEAAVVTAVHCEVGQLVASGDVLFELAPPGARAMEVDPEGSA